MARHNPDISVIEYEKGHSIGENEELIKRLHFIWIGSPLTLDNAKNIPGWIEINKGCGYDIFIWYDSKLSMTDVELFDGAYYCDINQYSLFNDEFIYDAYAYETGLIPRPGINSLTREIKNYGMATDVLRMCILELYGGFYMDLDMTPTRLCEYRSNNRIKSCPLRFCISLSSKPTYNDEYFHIYDDYDNSYNEHTDIYDIENGVDNGIINNGLYYDPSFSHYIDLYFSKFRYNYAKIMECHYYGYFLRFQTATIDVSGPGIFSSLFIKDKNLSSYKAILRDIVEDPVQSTHSWVTIAKHKDILAVLLYELFNDLDNDELIYLTYVYLTNDRQEDDIETMIMTIISKYLIIFNLKAMEMYENTDSFRDLLDVVTRKVIEHNSISLYLDLADLFINLPGPYIPFGKRGNYSEPEKRLVNLKFAEHIQPFLDKYNK